MIVNSTPFSFRWTNFSHYDWLKSLIEKSGHSSVYFLPGKGWLPSSFLCLVSHEYRVTKAWQCLTKESTVQRPLAIGSNVECPLFLHQLSSSVRFHFWDEDTLGKYRLYTIVSPQNKERITSFLFWCQGAECKYSRCYVRPVADLAVLIAMQETE